MVLESWIRKLQLEFKDFYKGWLLNPRSLVLLLVMAVSIGYKNTLKSSCVVCRGMLMFLSDMGLISHVDWDKKSKTLFLV